MVIYVTAAKPEKMSIPIKTVLFTVNISLQVLKQKVSW